MLLNRHNLGVVKFASTDKTRPAIETVHVTPKYTEATDGACLVRVTLPDADPADFPAIDGHTNGSTAEHIQLPASVAKSALRALPKGRTVSRLPILGNASLDPATSSIACTDLESPTVLRYTPDPAPTLYPDTDRVFPSDRPTATVNVDAKRLADLLAFLATVSGAANNGVTLEFHGDNRPLVIRADSSEGQEAVALLMTLRRP